MELRRNGGDWSHSALRRVLVVCLVAFDLLIIALAGWNLYRSRQEQVERAEMATHNLAQVLEQNLSGLVHQVDLALLAVKDEVERKGLPDREKQIGEHLRAQHSRVDFLNGLRTSDAQGFMNRDSYLPIAQPINVADREYFQHLRDHPEAGLFITRPIQGRISGKWIVLFARRLNGPDGGFAGVVFGTITLEDFSRGLSQVDVGPHGSISLRGGDFSLVARYPVIAGLERLIGDRTIADDYLQAIRSNRSVAHFTAHSSLDGSIRTYTLRRITDPPFYILVGLSQQDYLTSWRGDALVVGAAVSSLLILSALIAWMARTAWRRQLADKALLVRQEEKYRLLAENALDVTWTSDAEGHLTYVSPTLVLPRGTLPPEVVGEASGSHAALGHLQEQLWARLTKVRTLPPGSQPFEHDVLELALPAKDGTTLQAEVRVKVLWDHDGGLQGFQGVTRDITQRKAAEEALLESERRFRSLFYDAPVGHALNRMSDGWFLEVNEAFATITGYTIDELNTLSYWELTPHEFAEQEAKQLDALKTTGRYGPYEKEYLHKNGGRIPVILNGSLVKDPDGTELILSVVSDITDRKRGELEREQLIGELKQAIEDVRLLGGLLPICSYCKKIRDDHGYWNQIEAYISEHSEAEFSHGICPECAERYFPGMGQKHNP